LRHTSATLLIYTSLRHFSTHHASPQPNGGTRSTLWQRRRKSNPNRACFAWSVGRDARSQFGSYLRRYFLSILATEAGVEPTCRFSPVVQVCGTRPAIDRLTPSRFKLSHPERKRRIFRGSGPCCFSILECESRLVVKVFGSRDGTRAKTAPFSAIPALSLLLNVSHSSEVFWRRRRESNPLPDFRRIPCATDTLTFCVLTPSYFLCLFTSRILLSSFFGDGGGSRTHIPTFAGCDRDVLRTRTGRMTHTPSIP